MLPSEKEYLDDVLWCFDGCFVIAWQRDFCGKTRNHIPSVVCSAAAKLSMSHPNDPSCVWFITCLMVNVRWCMYGDPSYVWRSMYDDQSHVWWSMYDDACTVIHRMYEDPCMMIHGHRQTTSRWTSCTKIHQTMMNVTSISWGNLLCSRMKRMTQMDWSVGLWGDRMCCKTELLPSRPLIFRWLHNYLFRNLQLRNLLVMCRWTSFERITRGYLSCKIIDFVQFWGSLRCVCLCKVACL